MTPDPFRPGVGAAVDGLRAVLGNTNSSFSDHIRINAPDLLPGKKFDAAGGRLADLVPHGTTIVALTFDRGVLIAGDRRATQGNLIAARDVEKVYITDVHSAAGIAGTAGIAIEMVRLFAVELEHYEKIEGVPLTFAGKASRLSAMVRDNLGAAMQGLAAVPLFIGYDLDAPDPAKAGRIVSYDVVGGRSEERFGYAAVGSGSLFARAALKKVYRFGVDEEQALHFAVEALYDAADDDSATGGPDLSRRIYPTAISITADGATELPANRLAEIARAVIATRSEKDGGE